MATTEELRMSVRQARDSAKPGLLFAFVPASQRQRWDSLFLQDEIEIRSRVSMTLGLRMEGNPYTRWEALPSMRMGYELDENSRGAAAHAWASATRKKAPRPSGRGCKTSVGCT